MKKICPFLISSLFICLLSACSPNTSHQSTSATSSAGLYSNTFLSFSRTKASDYLPLNSTLVDHIRAVGGEVYQSGSFVTVVIPADAVFETTTSVMQPNAENLVVDVAKIIVRFPDENVIITAHADNIGSSFSQAKLTRDQAQLFAMMLWQQDNIDLKAFQRFKYAGMGKAQPITDDASPYGQLLNRRIQVTIYPSDDMEKAYHQLGDPDLHQI